MTINGTLINANNDNMLYHESIHKRLFLVTVLGKNSTVYEKCITDDIPYDLMTIFRDKGQWQYETVQVIAQYPHVYNNDKTMRDKKPIPMIKNNHKVEHKTLVVYKKAVTQDWIDCTCVETGISAKVQSTMNGFNRLPFVHPFAYEDNVREAFGKLAKEGKMPDAEMSGEILAGCLIAFLKSHNLLLCKNPIDANKYLCTISKKKLAFAIRWFLARRSFQDFPKLSLLDLHINHFWYTPEKQKAIPDAEIVLENYLRVCQGEKIDGSNYIAIPEKKKSVKVFTDKVKQEAKEYIEAQAEAKYLYMQIEEEFGGLDIAKPLLSKIKTSILALSFLSESNKQKIASEITSTFADFEPAAELAMIFRKTSTQAIQDDMLTFSQEQKLLVTNEKLTKVDFMSLLKTPKAKE